MRLKGIVVLGCLSLSAGTAQAHVCNIWLTPIDPGQPPIGLPDPVAYASCTGLPDHLHKDDATGVVTSRDTKDEFSNSGWGSSGLPFVVPSADGGTMELHMTSDSHAVVPGGPFFYTFYLTQRSAVTVRAIAGRPPSGSADAGVDGGGLGSFDPTSNWDGAMSLYRGVLPINAHDQASYDPVYPTDDTAFTPIPSKIDKAPGDPGIPQVLIDPSSYAVSSNPAWTPQVAATYASLYKPHNGYRDTLNFTAAGGVGPDGYPAHGATGQFDAFGDWSIGTEDLSPIETDPATIAKYWAKIEYITHRNAKGPGEIESLDNFVLPPGSYTLAIDGANCSTYNPGCYSQFYTATVDFTAVPVVDEPDAGPDLDSGAPGSGGASSGAGGTSSGGAKATGGTSSGGAKATGGTSSGGAEATGGASSGGENSSGPDAGAPAGGEPKSSSCDCSMGGRSAGGGSLLFAIALVCGARLRSNARRRSRA